MKSRKDKYFKNLERYSLLSNIAVSDYSSDEETTSQTEKKSKLSKKNKSKSKATSKKSTSKSKSKTKALSPGQRKAKIDEQMFGLFSKAIRSNDKSMIDIVSNAASVNVTNKEGLTPLFVAIHSRNLNMVKYLVESGADVHHCLPNGDTPLLWAAKYGGLEVIKYFVLDQGMAVDYKNYDQENIWLLAARYNQSKILTWVHKCYPFLEKTTDIYARDAAFLAIEHNQVVPLVTLENLKYKIDLSRVDTTGRTAVQLALENGNAEIIYLLFSNNHLKNFEDKTVVGENPLQKAVASGRVQLVHALIEAHGVNPAPLHELDGGAVKTLVSKNKHLMIDWLIDNDYIDLEDFQTPYHDLLTTAIDEGAKRTLKKLIFRHQYAPFFEAENRASYIELAKLHHNKDVVDFFKKMDTLLNIFESDDGKQLDKLRNNGEFFRTLFPKHELDVFFLAYRFKARNCLELLMNQYIFNIIASSHKSIHHAVQEFCREQPPELLYFVFAKFLSGSGDMGLALKCKQKFAKDLDLKLAYDKWYKNSLGSVSSADKACQAVLEPDLTIARLYEANSITVREEVTYIPAMTQEAKPPRKQSKKKVLMVN